MKEVFKEIAEEMKHDPELRCIVYVFLGEFLMKEVFKEIAEGMKHDPVLRCIVYGFLGGVVMAVLILLYKLFL